MMRSFLTIAQALAGALFVSCGGDERAPRNAVKTIAVPPRDTTAMRAHRNDSAFVVLRALAAMNQRQRQQAYQLTSYRHTDSGTLVTIIPKCPPPPVRCVGGGGLVLVDSLGKARVLQLFR